MDELMEVRKAHVKKGLKEWKNYYCDICKKEVYGELNWSIHNTSRKHRKAIKHIEKSAIRAKYQSELAKKGENKDLGEGIEEENEEINKDSNENLNENDNQDEQQNK